MTRNPATATDEVLAPPDVAIGGARHRVAPLELTGATSYATTPRRRTLFPRLAGPDDLPHRSWGILERLERLLASSSAGPPRTTRPRYRRAEATTPPREHDARLKQDQAQQGRFGEGALPSSPERRSTGDRPLQPSTTTPSFARRGFISLRMRSPASKEYAHRRRECPRFGSPTAPARPVANLGGRP